MASLREQLKELENPQPSFADPEDDYESLTSAKLSKKDSEIQSAEPNNRFGSIRSRVSTLEQDEKYHGLKVSRNDIADDISAGLDVSEDDGDDDSVASHILSEEDGDDQLSSNENLQTDGEEASEDSVESPDEMLKEEFDNLRRESNEDENDDDDDDDDGDEEEEEIENDDEDLEETVPVLDPQKLNEDISKGTAVKSQLELWDKFMEMRIKLQKCLQLSNKHPQHDTLPSFKISSGVHLATAQGEAKASLKLLLDKLLSLQDMLYAKNSETNNLLTGTVAEQKDEDSDEEIPSDTDEETEEKEEKELKVNQLNMPKDRKRNLPTSEYEKEIAKRHCAFQEFRDRTIAKWDEKTKLSSGKIRSKTFAAFDRSVVAQVKQVLSDKSRLLKRTQLKRSIYRVLGKEEKSETNQETSDLEEADAHLKDYDEEIFDDDDFYHQLIKELIERKSNFSNSNDPVTMGRQWLELQRFRRKAKRKIDVKASKGRRVRYNIHPKLVNLMAPISAGTMSDQAKTKPRPIDNEVDSLFDCPNITINYKERNY